MHALVYHANEPLYGNLKVQNENLDDTHWSYIQHEQLHLI
jgi:hypothetical protein